jgi:O-acetyl-ADP-ribose deacetylase (regulator of RNase III)/acylphosphatase
MIGNMAEIEIVLGDITGERTDAIVNAANESLRGGGGVDGAIHHAAGPKLAEAGAKLAPCRRGDAVATPAFELDPPVRHVIHTVGPVWKGGNRGEAEVLASCYHRCLEAADSLGVKSIAFPAISTGIYGYPPKEAARVAIATLTSTPTRVERIRLVCFDKPSRDILAAALAEARRAGPDAAEAAGEAVPAEDAVLQDGAAAGENGGPARLTAWVYGHVQGVGFRASVRMRAVHLKLSGWAANLSDGSVEVVAEGERSQCQELLTWLETGRTPGRVSRVTHRWAEATGKLDGFTQR